MSTTSTTAANPLGDPAARFILLIALLLIGLSAGFFYTYEVSVTRGLAEVDDPTYVQTFKAINATIRNAPFGIVFFGPVPAIALAIATNVRRLTGGARWLLVAALPLYLATIGITVGGNVVLNDELAATTDAEATEARADFEDDWNALNLVRTVTTVGSFAAVAAAATASTPSGRSGATSIETAAPMAANDRPAPAMSQTA